MGEESKVTMDNMVLYMNGEPIGKVVVPLSFTEFDFADDGIESEFDNLKHLSDWNISMSCYLINPRCKTRKRYIKLLMSCGLSRNQAKWAAKVGLLWGMSYSEAWRKQLWREIFTIGLTGDD